MIRHHPGSPLFPYPTLFGSRPRRHARLRGHGGGRVLARRRPRRERLPREEAQQHARRGPRRGGAPRRSEEHTSELQSRPHLVCRLLLEKKKKKLLATVVVGS